jgi:hypothetical protein
LCLSNFGFWPPITPVRREEFSMEGSVPDKPNQMLFSLFGLKVAAQGRITFMLAGAVSLLIVAVAWRLVMS